jgi:P27 family predicted phage terminase small subunit
MPKIGRVTRNNSLGMARRQTLVPRPPADPNYLALSGQPIRPSRAVASVEPSTVPTGRPVQPPGLSHTAAKQWRYIIRLLQERGTLSKGDGPMIEVYCQLYDAQQECLTEIKKYGRFENSVESLRVETAASKAATKLAAQLRQILIQLGLAPQSREKVKRVAPNPKSAPPVPGSLAGISH